MKSHKSETKIKVKSTFSWISKRQISILGGYALLRCPRDPNSSTTCCDLGKKVALLHVIATIYDLIIRLDILSRPACWHAHARSGWLCLQWDKTKESYLRLDYGHIDFSLFSRAISIKTHLTWILGLSRETVQYKTFK